MNIGFLLQIFASSNLKILCAYFSMFLWFWGHATGYCHVWKMHQKDLNNSGKKKSLTIILQMVSCAKLWPDNLKAWTVAGDLIYQKSFIFFTFVVTSWFVSNTTGMLYFWTHATICKSLSNHYVLQLGIISKPPLRFLIIACGSLNVSKITPTSLPI